MRPLQSVILALALVMGLSVTTMIARPAHAIIFIANWDELTDGGGDAGGLTNPQLITSPIPVGSITGTIGGSDMFDVFGFFFGGGDFFASIGSTVDLVLSLFKANLDVVVPETGTGSMSVTALGAGNYLLKVSTDFGVDPPFTITFNTPVSASQIPEPATLALFGLGLAGFGFLRRKRAA